MLSQLGSENRIEGMTRLSTGFGKIQTTLLAGTFLEAVLVAAQGRSSLNWDHCGAAEPVLALVATR